MKSTSKHRGKKYARPIGLGLGLKTRDPIGPTRTGGSQERTPLPGRASGPPTSPPRSRPSPVPLPDPCRRKQAALHPKPHARKRLTRLRTSHFVPSTWLKDPSGFSRPQQLSAVLRSRGLYSTSRQPRRASVPRRPPFGLSFRSFPPPAEGGSRTAAAFTSSSSCGRKVHRAPGPLSGGCAAAPRRAAHKAALRVPPPPPPPPPARPGAALGLAVPRRSSRRGGRRGASVRWAGRHCRSLSGRGRAVSEKAPPGACARVSAQDPGGPPARTSSQPGPWSRIQTRTPLAAARARPAKHPGADASRTHRRVTRAVREHARAGRAPRSFPFLRQPCLRLPRARGCRAWGRQRRHQVGAKACRAERFWEDRTQKASKGGARVAGSKPRPCGPVRARKTSRSLRRGNEFITFWGHREGRGRNRLKDS
ncbi:protein transport protein SEC31-like [Pteropus medius]|uniref:protein transport protein SEC31-like n=1 Tax=Pteropus vampyrus TaxID=132908 RepID=UPI00196B3BE8|nr:protein transport protein SEC31-like [Pteropus giganteus]